MNIEKILKQVAHDLAKSTTSRSYYDMHTGELEMRIADAVTEVKVEIGEAILEHIEYAEKKEQNEK